MCTGLGQSTATITPSNANDPKASPEAKAAAAKKLAEDYGLYDKDPPPPAAPDLGDQLLQKAGIDSKLRNASKQGRKSSFLTGAMGDVTEPIVSEKKALGRY